MAFLGILPASTLAHQPTNVSRSFSNLLKVEQIPTHTLFVGQKVVWLPQCQSTNTEAMALVRAGQAPEGVVVGTDEQTAGRGQRGNHWLSAPGENLTVSIVLRPTHLSLGNQFVLSMAAALAVRQLVQNHTRHTVTVKWPNDIYVGKRKIAGLLLESQLRGNVLDAMVIGIGLNVNQLDDLPPTATSLSLLEGQLFNLPTILGELCQLLESQYLRTKQGNPILVRHQYVQHLMNWQTLQNYRITLTGEHLMAAIVDVMPNGRLVLMSHDGRRSTWDLKEVELA